MIREEKEELISVLGKQALDDLSAQAVTTILIVVGILVGLMV